MLSKKHYEEIANILCFRIEACINSIEEERAVLAVMIDLAKYFERDNPKFNRTKFLKACNPHDRGR